MRSPKQSNIKQQLVENFLKGLEKNLEQGSAKQTSIVLPRNLSIIGHQLVMLALKNNHTIKSVDFSVGAIQTVEGSTDFLTKLADLLEKNKTIQDISLDGSYISLEGARRLIEVINKRELDFLSLGFCRFEEGALKLFADYSRGHPGKIMFTAGLLESSSFEQPGKDSKAQATLQRPKSLDIDSLSPSSGSTSKSSQSPEHKSPKSPQRLESKSPKQENSAGVTQGTRFSSDSSHPGTPTKNSNTQPDKGKKSDPGPLRRKFGRS